MESALVVAVVQPLGTGFCANSDGILASIGVAAYLKLRSAVGQHIDVKGFATNFLQCCCGFAIN